MKIAFYVSGKATRLQKVLSGAYNELVKDIELIISDGQQNELLDGMLEDLSVKKVYIEYDYLGVDKNQKLSDIILENLNSYGIEYCFSFGDHLLKGELLETYKNRIINFHPSILPSFKGRKAIDKALSEGAQLLGNTAHFIDSSVDGGPIIMQNVLSKAHFYNEGYDSVLDQQIIMLRQIHKWLKEERIKVEKNEVKIKDVNYEGSYFFPEIENDFRG